MSKQQTLTDINNLSESFKRLKNRHKVLLWKYGEDLGIPESDVTVDTHTLACLNTEVDENVEFTRRTLARGIQKSVLSVSKLRANFYDRFACHEFIVSSFFGDTKVATIKTRQLPAETKFELSNILSQLQQTHPDRHSTLYQYP